MTEFYLFPKYNFLRHKHSAVESAGAPAWLAAHWTVWRHCNPPWAQSSRVCYQLRNIKILQTSTPAASSQAA